MLWVRLPGVISIDIIHDAKIISRYLNKLPNFKQEKTILQQSSALRSPFPTGSYREPSGPDNRCYEPLQRMPAKKISLHSTIISTSKRPFLTKNRPLGWRSNWINSCRNEFETEIINAIRTIGKAHVMLSGVEAWIAKSLTGCYFNSPQANSSPCFYREGCPACGTGWAQLPDFILASVEILTATLF